MKVLTGHARIFGGHLLPGHAVSADETYTAYGSIASATSNNTTATLNQTDRFGSANSAYLIEDTDPASVRRFFFDFPISNGQLRSVAWVIKADAITSRFPQFEADAVLGTTAVEHRIQINTQTGAKSIVSAPAGSSSSVQDLGGWWLVRMNTLNNSSGNNTFRCVLRPCFSASLGGASTSSLTGSVVWDETWIYD